MINSLSQESKCEAGELYLLTFASGRQYVGISRLGARSRYRRHRSNAEAGLQKLVYRAWRKYGAPSMQVLAVVHRDDLDATEARAIAAFRTAYPHGYNVAPAGRIGPSTSRLVAARISASKKGKPIPRATLEKAWAASRAKKWTDEERARLSAAHRAKPNIYTAEARAKISKAHKGRPRSAEWSANMSAAQRGKKASVETRGKMSEAQRIRLAASPNSAESYARGWATRRAGMSAEE